MKVIKEIWEKNSDGALILISIEEYHESESQMAIKIKEFELQKLQKDLDELKKVQ